MEELVNGESGMINGSPAGREEGDVNVEEQREGSQAWRDGTIQSGRISGGDIRSNTNTILNGTGGRLDDDTLSRAMEERMRLLRENDDEDVDEDGMHL